MRHNELIEEAGKEEIESQEWRKGLSHNQHNLLIEEAGKEEVESQEWRKGLSHDVRKEEGLYADVDFEEWIRMFLAAVKIQRNVRRIWHLKQCSLKKKEMNEREFALQMESEKRLLGKGRNANAADEWKAQLPFTEKIYAKLREAFEKCDESCNGYLELEEAKEFDKHAGKSYKIDQFLFRQ
eukprot:gene18894-106_t